MKGSNGCNKLKCPCRLWVHCNYYVDETDRRHRLNRKKTEKSIEEYYIHIFRIDYTNPDIIANG